MDPNLALLFQREKKRNGDIYFDMELGLVYRGHARSFLDRGVVADGLFYVEVKSFGVSTFFVTGPKEALVRYGTSLKRWVERLKEEQREERISEGKRLIEEVQAKQRRRGWWKGLLGLRSAQ